MNEAISKLCQSGTGMLTNPTVIARNEAISKLCQSCTRVYFSKRLPQAFTLLFCLTLSLNSVAQKRLGTIADSSHKFIIKDLKPIGNVKPLIILNDTVYKDKWKNINPNSILTISVLKSPEQVAIYGPAGANGVVLIITKGYKPKVVSTQITLDSLIEASNIFEIDGEIVSSDRLKSVDLKTILNVNIIYNTAKDPSLNNGISRGIILVTKQHAVKAYQMKFSAFSNDYKQFIANNYGGVLTYFIDGKSVENGDKDFISKLYDVPANKIKSVVIQSPKPIESWVGLKVFVTTKK